MWTSREVASCPLGISVLTHLLGAGTQACGEAGAGGLARLEVGQGPSSSQNHLRCSTDLRWQPPHPGSCSIAERGEVPVLGRGPAQTPDCQNLGPLQNLPGLRCARGHQAPCEACSEESCGLEGNTLIQVHGLHGPRGRSQGD